VRKFARTSVDGECPELIDTCGPNAGPHRLYLRGVPNLSPAGELTQGSQSGGPRPRDYAVEMPGTRSGKRPYLNKITSETGAR
jgi:hypothetical protein